MLLTKKDHAQGDERTIARCFGEPKNGYVRKHVETAQRGPNMLTNLLSKIIGEKLLGWNPTKSKDSY